MINACVKSLLSGFGCLCCMVLCGCVAVNVGEPQVFRHTETRNETSTFASSSVVETCRGQKEQTGNRVSVGLAAEVREEFPITRWEETTTIRVQKRLGIGLFPGFSEMYARPQGALYPALLVHRVGDKKYPEYHALYSSSGYDFFLCYCLNLTLGCGILPAIGTIPSLLVEPFSGWSCNHDFFDQANMDTSHTFADSDVHYADASQAPKLRALLAFSPEERQRMGFTTCFDKNDDYNYLSLKDLSHFGILGCLKHQVVFVEPAKPGPKRNDGVEVKTRRVDVEGTYLAELTIPALGYKRLERVGRGRTRADFELPLAERRCTAEAVVRFHTDVAGTVQPVTRGALEKVAAREYRFDVMLEGGAQVAVGRSSASSQTTQSIPPSTTASVQKPKSPLYEFLKKARSSNGRYEVRVKIADKSKTFDVGWVVESDVKRMIREDYANRHPGMGIQYVRELVEWETEEDGAILVFRGWAFSARPVSDGWSYNAGTRRGRVRLRISEGMPADEAKRWARENIEAIVKEKNVVLEAGGTPPEGALYRSLGEALEDGVLTVEFEAVE